MQKIYYAPKYLITTRHEKNMQLYLIMLPVLIHIFIFCYIPYFISTIVVAGMVLSFINTDGIINSIIRSIGGNTLPFSTEPKYFTAIYTITNIWKSFGWNSILYLSAMSSIDPSLYEAAKIDGANRFKQMLHVTLPSIQSTIFIAEIFEMSVSSISKTFKDVTGINFYDYICRLRMEKAKNCCGIIHVKLTA